MSFRFCWRAFAFPLLLFTLSRSYGANSPADSSADIQHKLEHIEQNGAAVHPDQTPTVFTENEINTYFSSGKAELPQGIESVKFQGVPGVITGAARVDFDQLKNGRTSLNPLLSVFSGIHDIVVVAHAHGEGGRGFVHVDSVSLDGVEIPRFVLQLFVEKYLQPRYPSLGLDSEFELPDRIDIAEVGQHILTVTQK
jgi:hypothetical protein